jgi:hypothetical protein
MPSNGRRSGAAARRSKVSRRDARLAREELAAGGLSHHDRRRLRAITRAWELASQRRHREFRHLVIVVLSGIAAMAVIGAALGFVPAIEAASGHGATGTFVVASFSCGRRVGCRWVGTFEAGDDVVPGVVYEGTLPTGTGPGSRIPARYPGADQAYALQGSHTWALDLIPMLLLGSAVAFIAWLVVGVRGQRATSAV